MSPDLGLYHDVGSAVAFLASDRAGWITGQTLVLDGGQILGTTITGRAGEPVA